MAITDPRRRGAQPPEARPRVSSPAPIPAGAGLNLRRAAQQEGLPPDPRRRGAQPVPSGELGGPSTRSPQARGSTVLPALPPGAPAPIPAGAGLNHQGDAVGDVGGPDPRRRGAQPHLDRVGGADRLRSPQARGSTAPGGAALRRPGPIPAGAGLNRRSAWRRARRPADPRRRGAQPPPGMALGPLAVRSPQARGSTAPGALHLLDGLPIPAGAGLNRGHEKARSGGGPDPRRRGAQPVTRRNCGWAKARSPQARGSTMRIGPARATTPPIPAGAGLNRRVVVGLGGGVTDPRRRGAQPRGAAIVDRRHGRSPQARGSTEEDDGALEAAPPIPAGAGLNRRPAWSGFAVGPDPRRRGAQPPGRNQAERRENRSPQARGSTAEWHGVLCGQ